MNALTSELLDLRAQLEEATAAHAQEVKELQEQTGNLGRQRESCMREVSCAAAHVLRLCLCALPQWGKTVANSNGRHLMTAREV